MPESQPHSERWTNALIDALVGLGVTAACLAPGSRSTPLVAAVSRHPGIRVTTHYDERGAAFFCLGHARMTGRPALWITTSGTAVANGLPAVVEASVDHVALICLTADRPPELRGTGANQTIDQPGLFGDYPRLQADLPVPDQAVSEDEARAWGLTAYAAAIGLPAGPVHLNIPYRKPLEPSLVVTGPDHPAAGPVGGAVPAGNASQVWSRPSMATPSATAVRELAMALQEADQGVILAGRLTPGTADLVMALAETLSWPVLPDICSQLRLGPRHPLLVSFADLLAGHGPEGVQAVIQIGRMPVSQRLTRWLAAQNPRCWAVLADGRDTIDPHHRATHRLGDAAPATHALTDALGHRQSTAWSESWTQAERTVSGKLPEALTSEGGALTEPAVAALVAASASSGDALVLASSMPIRDVNSFATKGAHPPLVVANRGASGIDGTVATAAGASDALGKDPGNRTVLLIGDLALLHDLNSLALLRSRDVTVVVVNNDGGGIFSFLPIAAHQDLFEPHFGAPHGLGFSAAAQMFGISWTGAETLDELKAALDTARDRSGPAMIEVRTSRTENAEEHRRLNDLVGSWLR
ncbi:MAG: 2-succinyl-5-enolpyruvyl-6-hydroxy-3-cyclohexene-1-carboxylic-acid synthase [Rhodothermales bacterium]|nr:2-succinyl-5-enolpyruvyl-6-hydroxy-3-cyclohexene-1-carboxylic-acid synthase [Rhodothermales bacterium]